MVDEDRTYFVELEPAARNQYASEAVVINLVHPTQAAEPVRVRYDAKKRAWLIEGKRNGKWAQVAQIGPG